jgi:hypothetical protein
MGQTLKGIPGTYARKIFRITKWYRRLESFRYGEPKINPNTKLPPKRKELKPLEFYTGKVKMAKSN